MTRPVDYNAPLGISKREWALVLGANIALLLIVYSIATAFTLCDSDAPMAYMKQANAMGQSTIRRFRLVEVTEPDVKDRPEAKLLTRIGKC
jgi:hypothetical protein